VPTQVEWDNAAEMILHVELVDRWTWDEAYLAFEKLVGMMKTTPRHVSMIIDLTRSAGIPSDALTHAFKIASTYPENWELAILVGGGAIVSALLRVFSQIHPTYGPHLRVAKTLEDARALVISHRGASS
jgi:hypothetical protein